MPITYPIQETDRFTVYDTNTGAPLLDGRGRPMRGVKWGSNDTSQMVPNLADNIKWLLDVKESAPAHDTATEKLERVTTYDVANETATDGYNVVALTQAEIDERTPPHVVINGIKWKSDEVSQAAFSSMTLLIDKAGMAADEMVMIKDAHGQQHAMTVAQYMQDAVQYGLACYTAFHS